MFDMRQHKLVMRVDSCAGLHHRIDLDFDMHVVRVDKLGWQLFAVVCIDDRWFEPVSLYDKPLDEDVVISRYMYSV